MNLQKNAVESRGFGSMKPAAGKVQRRWPLRGGLSGGRAVAQRGALQTIRLARSVRHSARRKPGWRSFQLISEIRRAAEEWSAQLEPVPASRSSRSRFTRGSAGRSVGSPAAEGIATRPQAQLYWKRSQKMVGDGGAWKIRNPHSCMLVPVTTGRQLIAYE